jgi:hypothetical protein
MSAGAEPAVFWGLTAEGWTAVGTMLLGAATLSLVAVGYFQLRSVRAESRKSRTIEVCNRYDIEPVLDKSLRAVAVAKDSGDLAKNPQKYRLDVDNILNFLESIAIGVEQGLYDKDLVKDYMQPIMRRHVAELIESGIAKAISAGPNDFKALEKLDKDWTGYKLGYRERGA